MKEKIKFLTAIDMLFLLFLSLSGSTSGIISEIFYYLAFLGPVGMTLNYIYKPDKTSHVSEDEARREMLHDLKGDFTVSKENLLFVLPLFVPAIMAVLTLSAATTALLGFLGIENTTTFTAPLYVSIITHALLPAVLEELLFRFAPIKLLSENKKSAFLISAVMFSFAHANLFQIPYALFAGIILSALYMTTGSIYPSMILHFLNNTVSLLSIYGYTKWWFFVILGVLNIISVAIIFLKRSLYSERINDTLGGDEKLVFSYYPLYFIGTSLVLAISSLFV